MALYYKQNSEWKTADVPHIKQGGSWTSPQRVYIKRNGLWKEIYNSASPSILADEDFSLALGISDGSFDGKSGEIVFDPVPKSCEPIRLTATGATQLDIKQAPNISTIDNSIESSNQAEFRFKNDETGKSKVRFQYQPETSDIQLKAEGVASGNEIGTYT